MLQPRQNNLLTRLLNFPGQKNLIQNRIHLIKIKHQIQLTHIPKESIQHLYKKVNRLQIRQLVIIGVDARAKEQTGISSIDDLVVSELDKIGLVFLVARGYEAVDLL